MMAGTRHMLNHRKFRGAAAQQANGTTGFVLLQPVEIVAGDHAGFATRAGVEIDFKGVLLARPRSRQRD